MDVDREAVSDNAGAHAKTERHDFTVSGIESGIIIAPRGFATIFPQKFASHSGEQTNKTAHTHGANIYRRKDHQLAGIVNRGLTSAVGVGHMKSALAPNLFEPEYIVLPAPRTERDGRLNFKAKNKARP